MSRPTLWRSIDARHGLQLGVAVVASCLASAAVGMPQGYWAVMSALIVTRPDAGATLAAGWDRVRGTLLGTACGLAGVWLRHVAPGMPATTLGIVALLAFASAGVPILRSAPITALIVLSSGAEAGHSAPQVAALRVAEIGIGVAVGLLVSVAWPAARAAARFDAACAALLRQIAAQTDHALGADPPDADSAEAASAALRAASRRLVLLGDSAAMESRWLRPRRPAAATPPRIARLVLRTAQDAALLGRARRSAAAAHDPLWADLRSAACAALIDSADALERIGHPADLARLRRLDAALDQQRLAATAPDRALLLLPGPLRWLLDDLQALGRIAAATSQDGDGRGGLKQAA